MTHGAPPGVYLACGKDETARHLPARIAVPRCRLWPPEATWPLSLSLAVSHHLESLNP